MEKIFFIFFFMVFSSILVKAQVSPSNLLQQSINFSKNYKGLSYKVISKQTNPFKKTDTIYVKGDESIKYDNEGKIVAQNLIEKGTAGRYQSYELRFTKQDTFYIIDLKNNSYSLKLESQKEFSVLSDYRDDIKTALKSPKIKIAMKTDSVINNTPCYTIYIKLFESTKKNTPSFHNFHVYLDKKTLLPLVTQKYISGLVKKSKHETVAIEYYSEHIFYDYKIDSTLQIKAPNISTYKLKYSTL